MKTFSIRTSKRNELINITFHVQQSVAESGVKSGIACVFVPHTTAGVTLNENADPDVVVDVLSTLVKIAPENPNYKHSEGNSDAHTKSSLVGPSLSVIVENGHIQLGTWQAIYFAEFDGPRNRQCWVKVVGS